MSNLTTHRERPIQGAHREILSDQAALEPAEAELVSLRGENADLRARLEEMEQIWAERQGEFENLLEEKSDVIRGLHLKIQELQEGGGTKKASLPQEEELLELAKQLQEDRRQLEEDEKALMTQMREMELSMSRERAELARQRTELQRHQADFNREMELASRDASLRDRLSALQRRETPSRSGQAPADHISPSANTPIPKKNSGLFRRLFGQ